MLQILDCTLRDGGYYNNWRFQDTLVKNYLRSMEACSIDYVELGFRFNTKDSSIGSFGTTSEEFLGSLYLPSGLKYAVMINAKEFMLSSFKETSDLVNKLFVSSADSKISLVRVAINFDDALKVKPILKELKKLGYEIGLNLMQSNGKEDAVYKDIASKILEWNLVDILYFADSLGNMEPEDVKKIANILKEHWKGKTGFHSHNNKGYALINSITAIKEGVDFCDCTLTGMGRGAGNVTTESLLMELVNLELIHSRLTLLQGSVTDFLELKRDFGWGTNMHYQFAANNNIHPTFVQTLLDDARYDQFQSFKILESLSKQKDSSHFSQESLKKNIYIENEEKEGSWNPKGFLKNEEVILIGGGPSVKKYKKKILGHLEESNLEVIFLNINYFLPHELAVATVVSHEIRAFLDAPFYESLNHPLIMPMKSLGKLIKEQIGNVEIYDYGLNIKEGAFEIGSKTATLDNSLAAAYGLAVCTQAGAKKINLIGFDGYQKNDVRFQEMSEVIERYSKLPNAAKLYSLTPTLFEIEETLL